MAAGPVSVARRQLRDCRQPENFEAADWASFLVELKGLEVLLPDPPKCPLNCIDGFSASSESTRNDLRIRGRC
jgi:hypothetical protein